MTNNINSQKTICISSFDKELISTICNFVKKQNKDSSYYRECETCLHRDKFDIECDNCSVPRHDELGGCSCHQNPPCSYCVNNHYERDPDIIEYKVFISVSEVKNKEYGTVEDRCSILDI